MSPAWSPDCRKLAYVSFQTGRAQLYMMDIYTGKTEVLTAFPSHNGAPRIFS